MLAKTGRRDSRHGLLENPETHNPGNDCIGLFQKLLKIIKCLYADDVAEYYFGIRNGSFYKLRRHFIDIYVISKK